MRKTPEIQSVEQSEVHSVVNLPVMEHFYTIQGEGMYSGKPAYFVRLAGCDVGCFWCDVKESWEVTDDQKCISKVLYKKLCHLVPNFV